MLFLGVNSNIKGPGSWLIESLHGEALLDWESRKSVK